MTIPFDEFKARLLANPMIRAEYDALAQEFEISIKFVKAWLRGSVPASGTPQK